MSSHIGFENDPLSKIGAGEKQFTVTEDTDMSGLNQLLQSRRFVTFAVDAVLSIALYFVGKYFSVASDDLKFLIITLQPIAASVIAAFTLDDMNTASLANQLAMHTATLNAQAAFVSASTPIKVT